MKLVKARCRASGKYVILQVKDDGSVVTGMMRVSAADYEAAQSQVYLPDGATCVKSCPTCGSVKVFGCEHKYKNNRCGANTSPSLDCACCSMLEPDYGASSSVNPLQMKSGEVVRIPMEELIVGLNWERARDGANIDIDSSVVMAGNCPHELVYYGHLGSDDGSVKHLGDNVTGDYNSAYLGDDKENINVSLSKVSSKFDRLIFVVNIYGGTALNLGKVPGFDIKIKDKSTGKKMIGYTVDNGAYADKQSIIVGFARRVRGGWEFKAVGEGTSYAKVGDLADYAASHTR